VVEDQRDLPSVDGAGEVAVPERLSSHDWHGQPPLRSPHRMHHARYLPPESTGNPPAKDHFVPGLPAPV
jgi:hypothetical protein